MSQYIVGKRNTHSFGERVPMLAGEHIATIKLVNIKDSRWEPYQEVKDMGYTKTEEISILLENDLGETIFDSIGQKLNTETMALEFYEWKMNMYSEAIGIPVGMVFTTTQDWVNYIKNKRVKVVVIDNEKNPAYQKVSDVRNVEEGLAF